jgi:hypothetical protein
VELTKMVMIWRSEPAVLRSTFVCSRMSPGQNTSEPAILRSTFVCFRLSPGQNASHYAYDFPIILGKFQTYSKITPVYSLLFAITCPLYIYLLRG